VPPHLVTMRAPLRPSGSLRMAGDDAGQSRGLRFDSGSPAAPNEFYLRGAGCDSARTLEIQVPSTSLDWPPRRRFALPGKENEIGLRETSFGEGKLGYQLWTAGIALATFISANPALVHGKDVLELGSGIGLAGLACADVAQTVTLSDMDRVRDDDWDSPTMLLESLRDSVSENGFDDESVLIITIRVHRRVK